MGIIFNTDGTVTRTKDAVKDIQEKLGEQLQNYDSHLNCGFEELRTYRDDELSTSDWTQVPDGPLDSTTKAAWATYREKLRDLPSDAKAPFWFDDSDWPLAPGQSSINSEALGFIKRNIDPLGIATTSWVGLTTSMVEKGSLSVNNAGIGTDIVGVADTAGVQVGDTVSNRGLTVGIVAGITTVSISLASTTPIQVYGDLPYSRVGDIYYAQDKPELTASVSAGATTIVAGAGISFTITLTNQAAPQDIQWSTDYEHNSTSSSGDMTLTPVGTTGIGTVTVVGAAVTTSDTLYLEVSSINSTIGASASVGVTTT
tara:strand:+ start:2315 stop:3256 length:942 start_codon:yes stop_codon:yes gene_type:complete